MMTINRFPKLKDVLEGNFTLYIAETKTAVEPLSEACGLVDDATRCYVKFGRKGR